MWPSCGTPGGLLAKRQSVPLTLVALPTATRSQACRFAFSMAMACDTATRHSRPRSSVIDRRRSEITEILRQYNVPMIEMHP